MHAVPQEAVYIGDSIYDRQCSRAAGVDFGLAGWGAVTSEGFDPEYHFAVPQDITDIMLE